MSQEKHFTAGRLVLWNVGIALIQFIVFAVTIKVTGRIEDAVFAAMLVAFAVAFAGLATGLAVAFAGFAAMFATGFATGFAAMFATGFATGFAGFAVAFAGLAAVFAGFAANIARQDGAGGGFASLFYIASPLGIALAIVAFMRTGSWGVASGILIADIAMKVIVARRAEKEPNPAVA